MQHLNWFYAVKCYTLFLLYRIIFVFQREISKTFTTRQTPPDPPVSGALSFIRFQKAASPTRVHTCLNRASSWTDDKHSQISSSGLLPEGNSQICAWVTRSSMAEISSHKRELHLRPERTRQAEPLKLPLRRVLTDTGRATLLLCADDPAAAVPHALPHPA